MSDNTITVVDWLSNEDITKDITEDHGTMGGFFQEGMRWKDYISTFKEEKRPYLEAIRVAIVKDKLKFGGDQHQSDYTPLFSDGSIASFSFRGWGDIMAATWSEEENKDYCYMNFYMTCLIKQKE